MTWPSFNKTNGNYLDLTVGLSQDSVKSNFAPYCRSFWIELVPSLYDQMTSANQCPGEFVFFILTSKDISSLSLTIVFIHYQWRMQGGLDTPFKFPFWFLKGNIPSTPEYTIIKHTIEEHNIFWVTVQYNAIVFFKKYF